jgi:hypothetical protein
MRSASVRVVGVARFQQDGDREHKLEALKHAHSWMHGSFVTDQGWATMPGAAKPGAGVAVECDPDSRHQQLVTPEQAAAQ